MTEITKNTTEAVKELLSYSNTEVGQILVVGCSTSEVSGSRIGTDGSKDIAKQIYDGICQGIEGKNIYIAAQCCEHLNRCLVVEKQVAKEYNLCEVCAVPKTHAGGSFATVCYENFKNPVLVEHIKADMGIDIGDTLIGMHLRDVAVPVRIKTEKIGEARIICAKTRKKFIGGVRAVYPENI